MVLYCFKHIISTVCTSTSRHEGSVDEIAGRGLINVSGESSGAGLADTSGR